MQFRGFAPIGMLEELLNIFKKTISSKRKMKADFKKILKKKFLENADKYVFLDSFAGEFEYADCRINFAGTAIDRELIDGITKSVGQLVEMEPFESDHLFRLP
jgi:hypothetical protein